jgi:hypothetical protein
MGKFKSGTARHRDPRKQQADPLGPAVRPGQGAGGVTSSLSATADVGAVGLCSGADPPRLGGHTPLLPAIMPGRGVDENPSLGAGRARRRSPRPGRPAWRPPAPPRPGLDASAGQVHFRHDRQRGALTARLPHRCDGDPGDHLIGAAAVNLAAGLRLISWGSGDALPTGNP